MPISQRCERVSDMVTPSLRDDGTIETVVVMDPTARTAVFGEVSECAKIAAGEEPDCVHQSLSFPHELVECVPVPDGQIAQHATTAPIAPPRFPRMDPADGAWVGACIEALVASGEKVGETG